MKTKRILSVLITVVMLIGMLPTAVFAEGATYNLWVGGVQVTSANKDNIVVPDATGLAKYDPTNNTLTLDGFTYNGAAGDFDYGNRKAVIGSQLSDLTILLKGENTITVTDGFGIFSTQNLAICDYAEDSAVGSLNANAPTNAVAAVQTLTITGVNLTVTSTEEIPICSTSLTIINANVSATGAWGALYADDDITITNSKIEAYSTGEDPAFYPAPDISEGYTVYAGVNKAAAEEDGPVESPDDATYENKYVKIEPAAPPYDLWVGGVQVTSDNKDNVDGNNKVSYNPTTKTLTLNSYSYTGDGYKYDNYSSAAIYTQNDLTVNLVGSNTLNCTDEGICATGYSLTFQGNDKDTDTLTVISTSNNILAGNTTISNATITANDISAFGNLSITGSIVNTDNEASGAIWAIDGTLCVASSTINFKNDNGLDGIGVTITDSTITTADGKCSFIESSDTIEIADSEVTVAEDGISANDSLTISNSTVTTTGTNFGIAVMGGNMSVSDSSTVTATGGNFGIAVMGSMSVSGSSTVTATGGELALCTMDSDGNPIPLVPDLTDDFAVSAGGDATSAVKVDSPTDATYENKYVKIEPSYTITWIVDGEETTEQYTYGATPSFKGSTDKAATAEYTYTFAGWTPEVVAVTGEATYQATFTGTVNQYKVTFINAESIYDEVTKDYGATIVAPLEPEAEGYEFIGWYTDLEFSEKWSFETTITEDITLYAKWVQGTVSDHEDHVNEVEVEGLNNIAKAEETDIKLVVQTEPITEDDTEQTAIKGIADAPNNFNFYDITLEKSTGGYVTDATSVIEIKLHYDFSRKTNLKVYRYHNGIPEELAQLEARATAPYADGKCFIDAANNCIYIYSLKFSTYAVAYDPVRSSSGGGVTLYTIKFDTDGGSEIASKTVTRNSKIAEPTAPEKEGYTFMGWFTDESLTVAYDFDSKVTKSITLYAKWEKVDEQESEDSDIHNCPSKAFDDLDVNAWYHEDADYVIENGIFKGVGETTFAPSDKLTRAMLVTVLYRMENEPAINRSIPFSDVDMGAYYANAISWAKQNGIVNGVTENEFAPNDYITREQIATIMMRYAVYKGMDAITLEENLHFADADEISEYAVSSMNWAVGKGLINGKSESTLAPKDNATRIEVAAILHRFVGSNK